MARARVSNDIGIEAYLAGCRNFERDSQNGLYRAMYGFGMSVCLRYAPDKEEAQEILNDGFLKIFSKLDSYRANTSFKSWARRIWINTAIDYYRRSKVRYDMLDLSYARDVHVSDDVLARLSAEEILRQVRQLPPAYRMIFNLYAIEGYTHPEIAAKLSISVGTSKSNLAKARMKLKQALASDTTERIRSHG